MKPAPRRPVRNARPALASRTTRPPKGKPGKLEVIRFDRL